MGDLAVPVIGIVSAALAACYPDATGEVHFFAGDGPATAAFQAHTNDPGCGEPFLWVRAARRYRTKNLPEVAVEQQPCALPRAIALEVGVGRCAVTDIEPTWEQYNAEGIASLEDSWRIESTLCLAARRLTEADYEVVTEEIIPYGPEGGIIAWSGMIHIQF